MDDLEILLGASIFAETTPAQLSPLLTGVRRRQLARGDYFYRLGQPSTHAWVLAIGQAKMVMLTPDGDETVLDVILPGDLFGLPGLFSTTRHRVGEAVATEACLALSIERDALLRFVERHPPVMRRVLARLADLVREYAEAMALSAHDDLRGRVARRILDLAELHGEPSATGVRIRARIPQEMLGAMVGATRAKVNRAVSELVAEGHLSLDRGTVTVVNAERLRRAHPD